jgi:diguanylate cyclase (GGDEF)-like protein
MIRRLTFRAKIVLFTLSIIVIIVCAGLMTLSILTQKQIQKSVLRTTQQTSTALQRSIEQQEQVLAIETRLFADRPGTRNVYQADRATISDHLEEIKELSKVDWIVLFDTTGKALGSTKGAIESKNPIVTVATSGLSSKGLFSQGKSAAIVAAEPIKIAGYIQAVLVMARNMDSEFLSSVTKAPGSHSLVIADAGIVASTVQNLSATEFTSDHGLTINQKVHYAWYARKIGSNLKMITLFDADEIGSTFQPIKTALLFLLVVGCGFGAFGSLWIGGLVSKPIDALVSASQTLESGHWPTPFESTRTDEIGVLQTAFDNMTDSIRSSRERLIQMVDLDPLTEKLNYRYFRRLVTEGIESKDQDLWLGLIDLDQLEAYNQQHGTDTGDQLLVSIANLVQDGLPEGFHLARYSGNQFALLGGPEMEFVAEQVRRSVETTLDVTVSIGLCHVDEVTGRADLALLAIELAVGQTKSSGRNRVRVFEGFNIATDGEALSFLRQSSYAAVKALAEAVDAKDEYTRGHSTRVAEYARDLAQACGYESGFVDLVFVTGTLHDVGKIGVPDLALKKAGKLTDEEFEMIKLHPALGEKIVRQIPDLAETLPGIRSHHERWDGAGYPDALSGEEIPLIARVLGVADTFDAMTSDRPYRKGLSEETALRAIKEGAGTQFDPTLAKAFIDMRSAKASQQAA